LVMNPILGAELVGAWVRKQGPRQAEREECRTFAQRQERQSRHGEHSRVASRISDQLAGTSSPE